ncbi:MAG: hypothetical protein DDT19_02889 [Syntrophomonadaceae bacterium]|nr:hypothetical protein [Bacillota bacterium]
MDAHTPSDLQYCPAKVETVVLTLTIVSVNELHGTSVHMYIALNAAKVLREFRIATLETSGSATSFVKSSPISGITGMAEVPL